MHSPVLQAKDYGVIFNSSFSLMPHFQYIKQACGLYFQNIFWISPFIIFSTATYCEPLSSLAWGILRTSYLLIWSHPSLHSRSVNWRDKLSLPFVWHAYNAGNNLYSHSPSKRGEEGGPQWSQFWNPTSICWWEFRAVSWESFFFTWDFGSHIWALGFTLWITLPFP